MNLPAFWKKRIADPILGLLKQGITPEKIALSIAFGMALGVFPVLGSTTLLCTLAAMAFKLNLPAIQVVNYLVYPLQFVLLIPFYRAGELVFNAPRLSVSVTQIAALIKEDPWGATQFLWETTWHAMVVWGLLAPIGIAILYYTLVPVIRKLPFERANKATTKNKQ